MIGNITKGSDFGGLCRYLLNPKKDAVIIGGNMAGSKPGELEAEFLAFANLNQRVKKVTNHLSIGFAPEDGVITPEIQERIGVRIVAEMGYGHAQYLIVAHGREDPGHDLPHDHDHIHIVANAVDLNGQWVDDFQSFRRLEKILRQIEKDEGLKEIESSWEVKKRAPTHGQKQRYKREVREVAAGERETATLPVSDRLQLAIDGAAQSSSSVVIFARKLAEQGIETKLKVTRNGVVRGISYSLEGVSFQGNQLYDASLPKLQSIRGLTFDAQRSPKLIARISVNPHPQPIVPIVADTVPVEVHPLVDLFDRLRQGETSEDALATLVDFAKSRAPAKPAIEDVPIPTDISQVRPLADPIPVISSTVPTIQPVSNVSSPTIVPALGTDHSSPVESNDCTPADLLALARKEIQPSELDTRAERVLKKDLLALARKEIQPELSPSLKVEPKAVPMPVPNPQTDPRVYNDALHRKAQQKIREAKDIARAELAELTSRPKRSWLNWRGISEAEFALKKAEIERRLKNRLSDIKQTVKDNLKPLVQEVEVPRKSASELIQESLQKQQARTVYRHSARPQSRGRRGR
jgi:hypothetical protein